MQLPDSISLFDGEEELRHRDLNYDYIDEMAMQFADALADGKPCEAAYMPGDMTRYNLVIVPMYGIVHVLGTRYGDVHACAGMASVGGEYVRGAYLVALVGYGACAVEMGEGSGFIAASYVAEHLYSNQVSSHSIAVLLRAISHYLRVRVSA